MRRMLLALLLVALLSLAAAGGRIGGDGVAVAAANPQSTCAAVLTSFYGLRGQVDDGVHFLQQAAAAQGITFGELARTIAQTQGTLEQCSALLL